MWPEIIQAHHCKTTNVSNILGTKCIITNNLEVIALSNPDKNHNGEVVWFPFRGWTLDSNFTKEQEMFILRCSKNCEDPEILNKVSVMLYNLFNEICPVI